MFLTLNRWKFYCTWEFNWINRTHFVYSSRSQQNNQMMCSCHHNQLINDDIELSPRPGSETASRWSVRFMWSSGFPVNSLLFCLKVTDPLWTADSNESREKASFFLSSLPPPSFLSLPDKLELNFIKMTQSDCMRAEPSFPQCVVVGVGRFPGVCSDNRPICLPAQTQWPFRNGYEGITALFIWEYHIYPGAFWLLPSARVSTFTVWGGEAALHSSSHWSYTQSCFWYSVHSTSISESHQLLFMSEKRAHVLKLMQRCRVKPEVWFVLMLMSTHTVSVQEGWKKSAVVTLKHTEVEVKLTASAKI